ncbi:MAG: type II restriction endonuclease subunit M [Bacteroides sp.]|nr:type II restriction endonuclease subunit M [Bacteroides sp.]
MEYRFIDNIGDYFNPGFFTEDFLAKVRSESGKTPYEVKALRNKLSLLNVAYKEYKKVIANGRLSVRHQIRRTHEFHTELLRMLGYNPADAYKEWIWLDDTSVVPVRHVIRNSAGQTRMIIMEMQNLIPIGDDQPDGLFQQFYDQGEDAAHGREQRYRFSDWRDTVGLSLPEGVKIRPAVINRAVDEIFQLTDSKQRPRFILLLAGNKVFLLDIEEWHRGSYVVFDIEELLIESSTNRDYLSLFYLLLSHESLADIVSAPLMSRIHDASVRNAVSVTRDLKQGVIKAVEEIANEAIYQLKHKGVNEFDATALRDDALTFVYRLLFLFYAEARPELGILPMRDDTYLRGYSIEMLRDMEQVPMHSRSSREGYFFDKSIRRLFSLIHSGYNDDPNNTVANRFIIRKIDSPLFDDDKLLILKDVTLRNEVWQRIIESLSLSQERGRARRGRISYANLGINQLGSVYESLLAYRGFYTDEDYIEVHTAGKPEEGTFLVPRSRMDDFEPDEVLRDADGEPVVHSKGSFLYRLNGRDRKKSASYYTPEALTKSTVKYTLKGFTERLDRGEMTADELLDLKILEPAMGAAAFQNEVINQLAELYLIHKQRERKAKGHKEWRIPTDRRQTELQKVKTYIAVKNTYGIDLNRTAIELGKLAIWLNVMHADMETPWFAHHLAWGNAVVGAWFKTVEVSAGKHDYTQRPQKISFTANGKAVKGRKANQIYHFLLPDPGMLGILNNSDSKRNAEPNAIKLMTNRRKDWVKKLEDSEIKILQRLSDRVDSIISEAIAKQKEIDAATLPSVQVWGYGKGVDQTLNFNYGEKESLCDTRSATSAAFCRLKTAMDYWCSLWFWHIDDAASLPDRATFLSDMEQILGRDENTPISDDSVAGLRTNSLFPEIEPQPTLWDTLAEEDDNGTVSRVVYEQMMQYGKGDNTVDNPRLAIVRRLSARYRFFHPMLEFLEVFASRGGFDIVAGNPPWLKLTFTNEEVAADLFPEVTIHNYGGPKTAIMLPTFIKNERFARFYTNELYEYQGSAAFMNADVNYALLRGQQTNLFKCVLVNGFDLMNDEGYMGMLHPEGVYEDPNGQPLRREIYQRLRYHFQYINELKLFEEVHHSTSYSSNIYGGEQQPSFISISNLFNPATVDDSAFHSGHGICSGIKKDGKWNIEGHRDRIVHFDEHALRIVARTFEEGKYWDCCKLVSIHNRHILDVLDKLSTFPNRTADAKKIIIECLHQANAVSDGTMHQETRFPDMKKREMIFSGPHLYVGNPLYKTPREKCVLNSDYDSLDLTSITDNYIPRSNYIPCISSMDLREQFKGFNEDDQWMDYHHVAFRKMLASTLERTLIGAIIPPDTSHINGIISVTFPTMQQTVEFAGLTSSVVLDFYIKTIGAANLMENRIASFPLGIAEKFRRPLYVRTLMLNCLTTWYAPLWETMWQDNFRDETWSIDDCRLLPFSSLSPEWQRHDALRNYFERRQALVEIDVLTAMALGLSLEDLEMIYTIQFPVLQQNEADTWYDREGNIAFTASRGLTGVGMSRPEWNAITDKSQYTLCDRIADYRHAWQHFSHLLTD